nr:hypothetical protein BaRGS_013570 [Batillaria attramentaria]
MSHANAARSAMASDSDDDYSLLNLDDGKDSSQGDGDGSDTEEDHTPISEPCDKAYDDDRDKAYDDEESVQDFSLLADSDPHAAENVALGTPEAEEEKGEVESKGPTDQDDFILLSRCMSLATALMSKDRCHSVMELSDQSHSDHSRCGHRSMKVLGMGIPLSIKAQLGSGSSSSFQLRPNLELLQLYFESPRKSGGDSISDVSDHRQQGYIVLTFEDPAGLSANTTEETLQYYFENKRRSGGGMVKTWTLSLTQGVAKITFEDAEVSEDMLFNYFENKRRSGGGPVAEVKTDFKKGVVFITFENAEDFQNVQAALSKHRFLKKHTLRVEQVPVTSTILVREWAWDSPPTEDMLTNYFENARRSSGGEVTDLELTEDQEFALVTFADTEGLRQLIKGWAVEATRVVQNFLQAVHVEEVEVTGEEYEEADGSLRALADENEVGMRYIGQDGKMFIIWDRPEKQQVAEKMKKILNDVKRNLSRKKMQRKETVKGVPKGKLSLIQKHNIWHEIREKFPEMTVTPNTEGGFVELTGLEDEIQEAKLLLLEVLNEIVSVRQDWDSDLAVQLLKSPDAQSIIFAICLNADPEGGLEFASDYVEIHSFDGRRAEAMQVAARNAVQRRVIKFTNENAEARTLSAWAELKESLCQKNNGLMLLQEEEERLTIVSVSSTIKDDHQALKDFITQNTVQECAFDLDQPFHALLKSYLRDRQLGLPITLDDVFFDEDVGKIRVRGTRACIDAAETMYNMFCRSIVHIRKTYTQPSMKMFLQSPDWKYKCLDIEQRLQCKILEPTPELENFLVNDDSGGYGDVGQAQGRLSPEYADFLPSADDDEFVSAVPYPSAEELREKEQVEIKSIGVPALGTGTLKYPPQLVAETMFEAVLEYGRQHPATRISDMNFIVYKKDETNMQVFRAEHDKYNQLKQEAQAWEKDKFFQDTKGKVSLMFLGLSEKTVTEAARELMECYTQKVHEVSHDVAQLEQWDDLSVYMRGEDLDAVTLKAGDTEYNRVATWFMNSLKQPTAQITMIQRVQNATLYKQYMAMKKMLESPANLPAGRSLERQRMWHGTKGETKDGIIRYGFNRSYSDKNKIPNSSGRLYNTTVDDDTNPTIFVTYSDVQAYPEYLIVFKDN